MLLLFKLFIDAVAVAIYFPSSTSLSVVVVVSGLKKKKRYVSESNTVEISTVLEYIHMYLYSICTVFPSRG